MAKIASRVKWHHQECPPDAGSSQFISKKAVDVTRFQCSGTYFRTGNLFFAQIRSEEGIVNGEPRQRSWENTRFICSYRSINFKIDLCIL